jgi:hypothetical protein
MELGACSLPISILLLPSFAKKQAQREGLIAAPRKKEPLAKKATRHRSSTTQR